MEKPTKVEYVHPVPRWIISQDGQQMELYDKQMLNIVNSFLRLHLSGEVIEEWTPAGLTYRYEKTGNCLQD